MGNLQKLLFGWMSKAAVLDYLKRCTESERNRQAEILSKWEESSQAAITISENEPNIAETVETLSFYQGMHDKIARIISHPSFKTTFKNSSAEFKLVEIDKLVTFQAAIDMAYSSKLAGGLSIKSPESIVDFCFPLDAQNPPVGQHHSSQYSYEFFSESSDFRVTDVVTHEVKEGDLIKDIASGNPALVLSIVLGYGIPFVTAVNAGKKLVVSNGLHRLHALRSLGIKFAPAIVLSEPQQIPGFYASNIEHFIGRARPPLLKDFFDSQLTIELQTQPVRKVIRIIASQEVSEELLEGQPERHFGSATDYDALGTAIIKKQVQILGVEIAVETARHAGITVDATGQAKGMDKTGLRALLGAFKQIEGGFAIIAAKKAIAPFLNEKLDLPEELKD